MSSGQVQRYLRTEELYREIIDLANHDASVCQVEIDETRLRCKLDAIFAQGKIEGRLSGMYSPDLADGDRLIEDWQRIVDGAS